MVRYVCGPARLVHTCNGKVTTSKIFVQRKTVIKEYNGTWIQGQLDSHSQEGGNSEEFQIKGNELGHCSQHLVRRPVLKAGCPTIGL